MNRPGKSDESHDHCIVICAPSSYRANFFLGQSQQRPPTLAQNPALATQFRPPFATYGMPPRNVNTLQGVGYGPGLQTSGHRTPVPQSGVQNMVSQTTPGFIQQRGQGAFGFGGGLGQSTTALQQQQLQQSSSHQQQQANGTSTPLPPHLTQTPNLGTTPAVSSASDVGLDPNDFPALGSVPANNTSISSNGNAVGGSTTTSYASQAGTGVSLGSAVGTIGGSIGGSGNATRDFTPDDFPALGGQPQPQGQNQSSSHDNQSHPPGLNGFADPSQQHRQNLLGSLQPGTPGMLHLGQSRNVHPGFQHGLTEAEKQQQRVRFVLLIVDECRRVQRYFLPHKHVLSSCTDVYTTNC
jgi:CCR4-NOT transcription complex subunit 2